MNENFTKTNNNDNATKIDDSFPVDFESKEKKIINLENNSEKMKKKRNQ